METYLLLRSNKQSGPYSLQQIVNLGLKPYDLVWVEGKSAAWRYPSEVEGLKPYAPAAEEQPFDRFYKKSEVKEEEKPVSQVVLPKVETRQEPVVKKEVPVVPVETNVAAPSKKVFVSMPGGAAPRKQPQPVAVKQPLVEERPKIIEEKKVEPQPVYKAEQVKQPAINENYVSPKQPPVFKEPTLSVKQEAGLEEKYSESLEDIKKRYTETYLNRKKGSRWTSTHTSVLQVVGGAVFFCLLVVVAYKNFAGEETAAQRTTIIQPDKRAINTSTVSSTPVTTVPAATEKEKSSTAKKESSTKERTAKKDESLAVNSIQKQLEEITNEDETAAGATDEKPAEKKAVMPTVKSEEESKQEEVKPKSRPVNINRLVKVRANDYKQKAFGGVTNLELTVNNNSKFDLDRVIVELQYLKPSEQPIKTEKIVFNSIGANDSKTLKIPDFARGVKISYRVMDISSSQYERQTAGLMP